MQRTHFRIRLSSLALFCFVASTIADTTPAPIKLDPTWLQPPKMVEAPDFKTDGVRAVFFDGVPWKGQPTRVFAWIGLPKVEPGKKVPAMVLVHGGGGTAFEAWVKLWTGRGYAAIAMDTCGQVPKGKYSHWERDAQGGPPGWGGFDQVDQSPQDQWTYHAVADVILAHSLLRSLPEVDAERTGITGISWGGYLTCIVAGVDERFKFAVPVYGCGFLGEDSVWLPQFQKLGAQSAVWLGMWDPSRYLPNAKMPILWVDGTNDFAYPLDSVQKSYRLPPGARTLCTRVRMPHGHGGAGENPPEILAFADSILRDGAPLARVTKQGQDSGVAWVRFESKVPIIKAELNFTKDQGAWQKRKWETVLGAVDAKTAEFRATLPEGTRVYYLNLIDERGLIVSTEHEEVPATAR